ncbi:MAG: adenylate/guanylate cyclase domain-containing protein [Cytophagales bacterium]|nr:adenylate/guanylate cyclase domain-containing protein [Cytophagales bacterium]
MVRFSVLLFFILGFFHGLSQDHDPSIDSLENLLRTQRNDSSKVNNLIELSTLYLAVSPQKAIAYGNTARALAEKVKYPMGLGFAHKAIGRGYFSLANYPDALVHYRHSLDVFESLKFRTGVANILSNIGVIYFNNGEDTQSIAYHLRSLKVSEEINDEMRIGTSLNNIGGVYNNNPLTVDKALEYYYKALPIFERIKYDYGIGTISANIGEIYLAKNQYDSALHYMEESLRAYSGSIDATFPLTFLGQIYAERKDFKEALRNHHEAIEIADKLNAKLELTQALLGLAATQVKQGRIKDAISTFSRAEYIGESVRARQEMKTAYEELSKAYASIGDFRNAYLYESKFSYMKDTLFNNDEINKIQRLQFNFDIDKKEAEIKVQEVTIQRQKTFNYAAAIVGVLLVTMVGGIYNRYRYIRKTNKIIKKERDRSKELLLNILPEETAHELETQGYATTRFYENVSVLFTDFKGFTIIAGKLSPRDLVAELNDYFVAFDEIVERYGLEKIKTIGDAYMCAGGIPTANETHPINAVEAGVAMQEFMKKRNELREEKGLDGWELRIGIHSGPVVAGVVGKKKYAYDIWGDTVNIASRMESNGAPGKVNISATTYVLVKGKFECAHRGKVAAKNLGEIDMYFVERQVDNEVLTTE